MRPLVIFTAIITSLSAAYGNVPIIVTGPAHQRAAVSLCSKASHQLGNGDIAGAKRNVDAALRIDPKLWPALYVCAQIFRSEGKYELAIQDCNEVSDSIPGAWKHPFCARVPKCVLANTRTL